MVRSFGMLMAALQVFNTEAFMQTGVNSLQKLNALPLYVPSNTHNTRTSAFPLLCKQPSDGSQGDVFGSFFKSLFPSAEERRKEEVRRRRKCTPKPPSNTPELTQDLSPAVNNYIPPEESESGKVDIGINSHPTLL